MILARTVMDEEGEEIGLCGSPPATGAHIVLARGALSTSCMGVWLSFETVMEAESPSRICFSPLISRKVINAVQ